MANQDAANACALQDSSDMRSKINKSTSKRDTLLPPPTTCASPRPSMTAVANKKLWWQRTIVRRTAAFVKADLDAITRESSFLQKPVPQHLKSRIGLFHRSEIRTAKKPLGRGGFSEVYEILGFDLNEEISARLLPSKQAVREHYAATAVDKETGRGRFVIKHLKEDLLTQKRKVDFSLAATDMAVEAAYMSRFEHRHILPLRGLPIDGVNALEDGKHDGYFLILDRMQETLDQTLMKWKQQGGQGACDSNLNRKKTEYARQLACALEYLHDNLIVFRDLKPQNIGFNQAGEVQLFDFGLCRELPSDDHDQVYEMSGSGTRRYMAPEIINDARYNSKVDVYGWSMVVWQIFTLNKPYPLYDFQQHKIHVCEAGERPSLDGDDVPVCLHELLRQAWCASVADRLSFKAIKRRLDALLSDHLKDSNESSPRGTTNFLAMDGMENAKLDASLSSVTYTNNGSALQHGSVSSATCTNRSCMLQLMFLDPPISSCGKDVRVTNMSSTVTDSTKTVSFE